MNPALHFLAEITSSIDFDTDHLHHPNIMLLVCLTDILCGNLLGAALETSRSRWQAAEQMSKSQETFVEELEIKKTKVFGIQ